MPILNMIAQGRGGGGGGSNVGEPTNLSAVAISNSSIEIKWTDNNLQAIPPSTFGKSVLVRKTGSAPTTPSDGTTVVTETVMNTYQSSAYTDTGLTQGTTYYYQVFSYSTDGGITYGTPISATPRAVVNNYIPDMTADSQDGFVATSSTMLNNYEFHPWNAFHIKESDADKSWHSDYLGAGNWGWSGIQLPSGIKVTKLQIWARTYASPSDLRPIDGFNLLGSNDGTTWTNILSESGLGATWTLGSTQYWDITGQTTAYTYLKLELQAYSSYLAFDHWNISGEVQ